MAASLSISHSFHLKSRTFQEPNSSKHFLRRIPISSSCQIPEPINKSTQKTEKEKKENKMSTRMLAGFEKFGKGLKENMSPQQKGDWKDVMLMSLSFAVYVYVSQKIVCAYFAWMHLPKHPW